MQNLEGGPSVILGDFYPGIDLCSDGESAANLIAILLIEESSSVDWYFGGPSGLLSERQKVVA